MDFAPPPASGSRIQELGDRLIVSFRPHRSWPAFVFVGFWLTFWTLAGIAAFSQLLDGSGGDRAFLLFWLCGWAFGECAAILLIAWGLYGHEVVTVSPGQLEIRRRIGRFARTKRYDAALVREMKAARTTEEGQSRKPYWLEISLPKDTILVGDGLGEREAEYTASVLMERIHPRPRWSDDTRDYGPPVVQPPPERRSFPWSSIVFPVIVVGLLLYLGAFTLRDDGRPAAAKEYSDPHAYAVATTRFSLTAAHMRIVGRIDCGNPSWRKWSCTAPVEGTSGVFAGRRSRWLCFPSRGLLPGGSRGDLVTCGPAPSA